MWNGNAWKFHGAEAPPPVAGLELRLWFGSDPSRGARREAAEREKPRLTSFGDGTDTILGTQRKNTKKSIWGVGTFKANQVVMHRSETQGADLGNHSPLAQGLPRSSQKDQTLSSFRSQGVAHDLPVGFLWVCLFGSPFWWTGQYKEPNHFGLLLRMHLEAKSTPLAILKAPRDMSQKGPWRPAHLPGAVDRSAPRCCLYRGKQPTLTRTIAAVLTTIVNMVVGIF